MENTAQTPESTPTPALSRREMLQTLAWNAHDEGDLDDEAFFQDALDERF